MAGRNTHTDAGVIATTGQDERVAMTGGGIQIRHQGKPLQSTALRGGSVYLVIDCSASMAGGKIAEAKKGAIDFAVQALSKRYAVGMITFSFRATHICEPSEELFLVQRNLSHLKSGGSTNMADGITLASTKLAGKPNPLAMVVITDGVPDDEKAALAAAEKAKKSGIDIITVGTDDADRSFLEKLASRNDLVVVVQSERLGQGITSAAGMLPGGSGSLNKA